MNYPTSKNALDNWANVTRNMTEKAFVKELFQGVVSTSGIIDRFSMWLLAGTGATAALMSANLDKLLPILTGAGFTYTLYALVISALFGLLAKYKAIAAQSMRLVAMEIKEKLVPVLEAHAESTDEIEKMAKEHSLDIQTDIDPTFVFNEFSKAYPFWLRPFILSKFNKSLQDELSGDRMAANYTFWQSNYTILQALSFIGFILVVATYANGI